MGDSPAHPVGRLGWVQVDCHDPLRLAEFWQEVLSTSVRSVLGDPPQYVTLAEASAGCPRVVFQRVPEPKRGKNRLHLDVAVPDIDAATSRVEVLGASRTTAQDFDEDGVRWRVMQDPEGNEFCLVLEG